MYSDLSRMKQFTSAGYGVVIGEYGALPGSDGVMKTNAPAYHEAFLDCCDALDLANCLWDCSGFFVRKQLKIVEEEMAAVYASHYLRALAIPSPRKEKPPLTPWRPRPRKPCRKTPCRRTRTAAWPGSCSAAGTGP